MNERELQSICITVRPKNGLHNEYSMAIEKYLRKQQYSIFVYEMEAEARHLHAQMWGKYKINNVRKALFRIAEQHDPDWSPASKKVLSQGVKFAYNDYFHEHYLTKDNKPVHVSIPEDTKIYYPSLAEQEEIRRKATRVADAYFDHLKTEWIERNPEYEYHQFTNIDISKFYYDMMFKDKVIAVIRDDRQRKQNTKCLLHYIFPGHASKLDMTLSQKDIDEYMLFKSSNEKLLKD